jgi:hypothetical protein
MATLLSSWSTAVAAQATLAYDRCGTVALTTSASRNPWLV